MATTDKVLFFIVGVAGLSVNRTFWEKMAMAYEAIDVSIEIFLLKDSKLLKKAKRHCTALLGDEYWSCPYSLKKIAEYMAAPKGAAIPQPYSTLLAMFHKIRRNRQEAELNARERREIEGHGRVFARRVGRRPMAQSSD